MTMPRDREEPVRLTRIYTGGGDRGETSLGDGTRVPKIDCRIAAFGAVDELKLRGSNMMTFVAGVRWSFRGKDAGSPNAVQHWGD